MMEWLNDCWEGLLQVLTAAPWQVLGVWLLTGCLLLVGIAGSVLPLLPGPFMIFIAGVLLTVLLPGQGMSGPGLLVLGLLLGVSYLVDMAAGMLGARWFGASRWGILGVFVGGVAGLFFAPVGFLVGPLAGGLLFELIFAKKRMAPAVKSTWGTLLGTGAGLAARLLLSLVMVATVLMDALWW
jgi:uncharacterized protein YqgC (DUF456 family)